MFMSNFLSSDSNCPFLDGCLTTLSVPMSQPRLEHLPNYLGLERYRHTNLFRNSNGTYYSLLFELWFHEALLPSEMWSRRLWGTLLLPPSGYKMKLILTFLPWGWIQKFSPKRWYIFTRLKGSTFKKIAISSVTAVRTSNFGSLFPKYAIIQI
jgi:hypothetical protein